MRRAIVLFLGVALLGGCGGAPPSASPEETTPAATINDPRPTHDPEAELRRAIELRIDWGLRADEAWVRSVGEDPQAVTSKLGIPLTPDEASELEQIFAEDPRSRLTAYGAREHEQFGGLWVNDPPWDVVMLFTADLDRHREAVAALAPDMRVDIRPARFSEVELRRLQHELVDELASIDGVELLSLALDTKNNVLTLEAKSNDSSLEQRLEEHHGGRLVANIHPLPGGWGNAEGGDGWRLLADGRTGRGDEAYRVRAATNATDWQEMWKALDPVSPAPEVDFEREVVVSFGHGIGSSCPELRLDDVVIDLQAALVYSVTSDPLEPRACTADLVGAVFFVVALSRDALPVDSFTLRLQRDNIGDAETEMEVDLGQR